MLFGVIVMVHEFGHYLLGRLCGIGVLEFSVGFGPKILGWTRKGIDYSVRIIPLGGYCRFEGEDSEDDSPTAMNNQPVWKRILTVFAGPFMNFVLAYVACVALLSGYITAEVLPKVVDAYVEMPAAEAGLEAGDIIVEVNGTPITYDTEGTQTLRGIVQQSDPEKAIDFVVDRGGERVEISVLPEEVTDEASGQTVYQVDILFGSRTYTLGEALAGAGGYMVDFTKEMFNALKNMVFGGAGLKDTMGPVGIITFVSEAVREGMYMVLNLVFIISLNLGIMNLLPLPALDGGRILLLIVEGIRRKPIDRELEGKIHLAGFALLMILIVVVTYQDIARIISGGFNITQ